MLFIVIVVILAIAGGLQFFSNFILKRLGMEYFRNYTLIAKVVFYITWLFHSIIGIIILYQYGNEEALLCHRCLFFKYPAINLLIIISFYPLVSTLWKFTRFLNTGKASANIFAWLTIISTLLCYALFLGAVFNQLLAHSSLKPGDNS
jgi:hypothetical protein